MKISISEIVSHVGRPPSIKTQKKNYSRPVRSKRDPIVLKTSRGYKLLSGENIINEAKFKGIKEI